MKSSKALKAVLAAALALMMALSLVACGKGGDNSSSESQAPSSQTDSSSKTESKVESSEADSSGSEVELSAAEKAYGKDLTKLMNEITTETNKVSSLNLQEKADQDTFFQVLDTIDKNIEAAANLDTPERFSLVKEDFNQASGKIKAAIPLYKKVFEDMNAGASADADALSKILTDATTLFTDAGGLITKANTDLQAAV